MLKIQDEIISYNKNKKVKEVTWEEVMKGFDTPMKEQKSLGFLMNTLKKCEKSAEMDLCRN